MVKIAVFVVLLLFANLDLVHPGGKKSGSKPVPTLPPTTTTTTTTTTTMKDPRRKYCYDYNCCEDKQCNKQPAFACSCDQDLHCTVIPTVRMDSTSGIKYEGKIGRCRPKDEYLTKIYNTIEKCTGDNCSGYRGILRETKKGQCRKWSEFRHRFNEQIIVNNGLEKNYCRNPMPNKRKTIWCYVREGTDGKNWEYCDDPSDRYGYGRMDEPQYITKPSNKDRHLRRFSSQKASVKSKRQMAAAVAANTLPEADAAPNAAVGASTRRDADAAPNAADAANTWKDADADPNAAVAANTWRDVDAAPNAATADAENTRKDADASPNAAVAANTRRDADADPNAAVAANTRRDADADPNAAKADAANTQPNADATPNAADAANTLPDAGAAPNAAIADAANARRDADADSNAAKADAANTKPDADAAPSAADAANTLPDAGAAPNAETAETDLFNF